MSARSLVAGATAVALTLAVAACGSSSSKTASSSGGSNASSTATSKSPITVLAIGDTTGVTKVNGITQLAGIDGAAAYLNAHGGIDGHHVNVAHVSDNGDPTTAVSVLVQYLSSHPAPAMVSAGNEGGDAAGLIPVLAKKKVFAMALNDGNSQCLTDSQVTCPNEWTEGAPGIDYMYAVASFFKAHGVKKVGILEEQIDFTENETPDIEKALKEQGLSYSVAEFPATALDLTPEVSALKGAGATGVFNEALLAPAGYALEARAKLNWSAPMVFDIAASSADLTKLAPASDIKNAYEDIFWCMDPKQSNAAVAALLQYIKPFNPSPEITLDTEADGWDELFTLDDAVKAAGGSLNVNALDAAMLKLPPSDPMRLFSHKLGFTSTDHENVLASASDFSIVPAGPLKNGQVDYPGS